MNSTSTTPRIYVACLASYNNGTLHGVWIDADQGEDHIQEQVNAMLRASKYPNVTVEHEGQQVPSAEEWAIHDYEGFAGIKLSEYESFENVAALAELISEHDEDLIHAATYVTSGTDVDELKEVIEYRYRGCFDSEADYAAQLIEDCYNLKDIPDIIKHHIDYEGVANDMQCGGDCAFVRHNGSVYVFDNG